MNPRILFIASCIALVTSAFTFSVRGEILQDMGNAYQLTQEQKGSLEGAVFLGMAFSMVVGGFICDLLGMKRIMLIAFLCHLVGVCGTIGTAQRMVLLVALDRCLCHGLRQRHGGDGHQPAGGVALPGQEDAHHEHPSCVVAGGT